MSPAWYAVAELYESSNSSPETNKVNLVVSIVEAAVCSTVQM